MNFPSSIPDDDCQLCPRLVDFRNENRIRFPNWHNRPVASFGSISSHLLIVGLAPGLKGANRTGRPFTGDVAGDLLYPTLMRVGLAKGDYTAAADDRIELVNCRITNAVRCVPPQNKVTGPETAACRSFLITEIAMMKDLKIILALGGVAHGAVLSSFGEKKSASPFSHGARHELNCGLSLMDSYHCSRYNTNTGRLTIKMFNDVFQDVVSLL
jgi:uracil-DNA glycosylase family 4